MSGAGTGALSGAASGAAIGTQILPGWGTVIGGAVGAIGGYLSGQKADKAAAAAKRERKLYGEQNMAMNRELFEQEKKIMRPIKERLGAAAMSEEPLDYAQTSQRIRENYAAALRRSNEASGLGAARAQGARLKMAGELAGLYQQGLTNRRNLGLTLMNKDQTATYAAGLGLSRGAMMGLAGEEQAAQEAIARESYGMAAQGLGQALYGIRGLMGGGDQTQVGAGAIIPGGAVMSPATTPGFYGGLNTVSMTPGLTGGSYGG